MNKILIISLILTSFSLISNVLATTDTVGDTTDASGFSAGNQFATQITASASGNLESVGINWQGATTGNAVMGIYSDNLDLPNTLLASSSVSSITAGWVDFTVTGVSISAGSKYWIAVSTANNGATARAYDHYYGASGGKSHYTAHTYDGTLLATWGVDNLWTGLTDQVTINSRMTYTPAINYIIVSITSPTNTTYSNSNPNITFTPIGSNLAYTCNWIVNSFITKNVNVSVENNTEYSNYPTGNIGGLNGTNEVQAFCSNSTLTNSSSFISYNVSILTSQLPVNYGIKANWINDAKNWVMLSR